MSPTDDQPSQILRALLEKHPGSTNPQLADLFVQKFPLLRRTAKQAIWRWSRDEHGPGRLSNVHVDAILHDMLRDAGYVGG